MLGPPKTPEPMHAKLMIAPDAERSLERKNPKRARRKLKERVVARLAVSTFMKYSY